MTSQHSLNKQQKESIFLLQIGTFLEYFDLMIYVHMAVLLNELFFPPADPKTAAILTAFAFCSTYLLRPFGALVFGYIGDNYGRKPTVIITTIMMACSCIVMVFLPTYAEIGISAAIIVSVLRVVQGMSSMGEIMGAQIYITEITKPPVQYLSVGFISIASSAGAMAALGVASLATRVGFNWRIVFALGAAIAFVGLVARTRLRETPEFTDAQRKMKKALADAKNQGDEQYKQLLKGCSLLKSKNPAFERVNLKSLGHYFAVCCGWPLCFYLIYMYFIPILKGSCGYSSADVITHNFYLSILTLFTSIFITFCSKRIYPLFISKIRGWTFVLVVLALPFIANTEPNNYVIFFMQSLLVLFNLSGFISSPIFIRNFPIFRRFTAITFSYALSRALMYVFVSFGLVYLTEWFGYYGIWIVTLPIAYFWINGISHYESIEKEVGNYPLEGEWQVRVTPSVI